MAQPHRRNHVKPVHPFVILDTRLVEPSFEAKAGVVDQQFQAGLACDALLQSPKIAVIGQISGEGLDRVPVCLRELGSEGLQAIQTSRNEEKIVTPARQMARKHFANACGSTRHDSQSFAHPCRLSDIGQQRQAGGSQVRRR
jgi:hypothetical protein